MYGVLDHEPRGLAGRHRIQRGEGGIVEQAMKNRDDKQKDLEALRQDLERVRNLFVTGFEKLTVSQDFQLRKAVRSAGGTYRVIKNNIAEKAAEGTPSEAGVEHLTGL